jgi:glycosyltransferase involved in cell wall biosynthesis
MKGLNQDPMNANALATESANGGAAPSVAMRSVLDQRESPNRVTEETQPASSNVAVSVIVPLLNEQGNTEPLYCELSQVLAQMDGSYEIIFVDDGSTDDTAARLKQLTSNDPHCLVIELTRNFGQTAALAAGFAEARGRVIVPIDGDLQNDPRDIPALIARLYEPPGFDVVSGWRRQRHDKLVSRRVPSQVANWIIRRLTHTPLHDFGCTLKAYRREVLADVTIYGEMHRFLPVIVRWRGARLAELVVNHRPRVHGSTKYDLRRTIKVMLDLITVKFLGGYLTKPLYFFGKAALLSFTLSITSVTVAVFQKFGYLSTDGPLNLNRNVLVLLGTMLFLMTVMLIMLGVVAELLVRIYHESQDRAIYKIRGTTRGKRPHEDESTGA